MRIPRIRARFASACLAGMAGVHIGYVWWAWELSRRVDDLGRSPSAVADIREHAQLLATLDSMWILGLAVTGVVFLSWFYQICDNARLSKPGRPVLGTRVLLSAWILPVINWVMPYIMVVDAWKEGHREEYVPGAPSRGRAMHVWGVSWVATCVAFSCLFGVRDLAEVESMDATATAVAVMYGLGAVAAIAAVFMVQALTARQDTLSSSAAARVVRDHSVGATVQS